MQEIWKDIVGYEGRYQVSNFGFIKSLKRKSWNGKIYFMRKELILKPRMNHLDGRARINLYDSNAKCKTYQIHRLVLETFIGKCPYGMEACHNDSNYLNNRLDNLRWDTHKNNEKDKRKNKTHGKKYSEEDILRVFELNNLGKKQKDIAKITGISKGHICNILRRWCWGYLNIK